jgi:DNA-binding FrmR family transcriptional regulator
MTEISEARIAEIREQVKSYSREPWLRQDCIDILAALDAATGKIENATQAMAETHRSWEHRCHAIMAALDMDFGGVTPDVPEQDSWYARNLKRSKDESFTALTRALAAETEPRQLEDLVSLTLRDWSDDLPLDVVAGLSEAAETTRAALAQEPS